MQSAPASMVAMMLSGVGPPVAMIGTLGNFSLILRTTCGVLAAADTLRIETPASSLA